MGLNTLIENLQKSLIDDINNSQLPIGIVYYIAKDVFSQVENEYQKVLKMENDDSDNRVVEQEIKSEESED